MQEKNIKIIDNFLDLEYLSNLKTLIFSNKFSWFFVDGLGTLDDNVYYHFQHLLYDNNRINSPFFDEFELLFSKLDIKSLIRVRINLTLNLNKEIESAYHVDQTFNHKTAIFYFHTTNGKTILKNKNQSESEIECVENRMLIMNKPILHKSQFCTDNKRRIIININYF